jgi:general secretion pathway protein L
MLERQAVLPLSAELDLDGVLRHEMDRLTPFHIDEVLWDCTVARRDRERGRIHARVRIVPLRQVEPLLNSLRRVGLIPVRIQATGFGETRSVPIADAGSKQARNRRRVTAGLQFCTGALAVMAAAMLFVLQAIARNDIEARIDAMRPQVTEAETLRKVIARGASTADIITATRAEVGNLLQAVAVLTEVLPDDTHLTQLAISQRKVSINGRSAAAARLIGVLAAHPLLHNPAFPSPVLRNETNSGEVFSIRVEVGS